nr:helix-turn-helix domain-containing protein [Pseudofrankia asymbiotica]
MVLALDGVMPFELSMPAKIFGTARDTAGCPLYEVLTCSLDGEPVTTAADYSIAVTHDAAVLATADTIAIPPADAMTKIVGRDLLPAGLTEAFGQVRADARVVSLCLASYVLAALGRLDDLPATTHWRHAENFQRAYPTVHVDPDVLFVEAGQVFTSAGAAAGVDLCLHLVRRDHGSGVANQVARGIVVAPWREGGQAQYIERPVPQGLGSGTAPTRSWAIERLDQDLRLDDLAAHAGMSRRTFTRRFRSEVGQSPWQWLLQQRVDLARNLLEHTDMAVDRIAESAGFGTAASLRENLRATIAISPTAYRRTFRG